MVNKDERVEPGRGTGRRHRTRVTRSKLKPLARIARGGSALDRYPQQDIRESCLVRSPFLHTGIYRKRSRANLYSKSLREALLYAYNTHVLLCNVSFCCVETTSIKVNKSLTTERLWTLLHLNFIHFDSLDSEHGQGLPTPALRDRPCSPRG